MPPRRRPPKNEQLEELMLGLPPLMPVVNPVPPERRVVGEMPIFTPPRLPPLPRNRRGRISRPNEPHDIDDPAYALFERNIQAYRRLADADEEGYKKGGKVTKTGMAKVHKGEVVIPKARVEAVEKAVKKAGLKSIKVPSK